MENKNGFKDFVCSAMGRVVMIVVMYVIVIGLIAVLAGSGMTAVVLILGVLCGYFGWQALNRITPNIFLVMSWVGWLFYFAIKGFLSVLIGYFVLPFILSKKIVNHVEAKVN